MPDIAHGGLFQSCHLYTFTVAAIFFVVWGHPYMYTPKCYKRGKAERVYNYTVLTE